MVRICNSSFEGCKFKLLLKFGILLLTIYVQEDKYSHSSLKKKGARIRWNTILKMGVCSLLIVIGEHMTSYLM